MLNHLLTSRQKAYPQLQETQNEGDSVEERLAGQKLNAEDGVIPTFGHTIGFRRRFHG